MLLLALNFFLSSSSSSPPPPLRVAEIGIGCGATSLQVLNLLDEDDEYFVFDYETTIKKFSEDLKKLTSQNLMDIKCKVLGLYNSNKEWDSYNWNLSNLVLSMRDKKLDGILDVVYLDGAHTFLHDGLAVCLLKELVKKGGFLILDDLFWTYSTSKWGQRYGTSRLTQQQMDDKQILRVQEIFLTHDPNFIKLSKDTAWRGVFRKLV